MAYGDYIGSYRYMFLYYIYIILYIYIIKIALGKINFSLGEDC